MRFSKRLSGAGDRRWAARLAVLPVLAAVSTGLAACSSSSSSSPPSSTTAASSGSVPGSGSALVKLEIGAPATAVVGLTPSPTGPAGWAIEQGKADAILAKYGYAYGGFAAFVNGPPAAQALASGSVQLVSIGDAPAILARGAGQDNRAILMSEEIGGTWIVARNGGPTSSAQLAGKKVGVQFGSDFDHYLRYVLAQNHLTGKVTLVNLTMGDGYAALTSGAVDAYSAISSIAAVWEQKGGVTVINKAEVAYPNYASAGITLVNDSFLKQHPNIQQAWWAVYNEGQELIKQNPTAYLQWTAKESGESYAIAKETTILTYQDAPITAGALSAAANTEQFLVQQKLAASDFSLSSWAVNPPSSGDS